MRSMRRRWRGSPPWPKSRRGAVLFVVAAVTVALAAGAIALQDAGNSIVRWYWWIAAVYALGMILLVVALLVSPSFYREFFQPFGF